jgi:RND superfamily putative drug exporter
VAIWALVIALGLVFGTKVFTQTSTGAKAAGSESAVGNALLSAADPAAHSVVALVDGVPVDSAQARTAVAAAAADVSRISGVVAVSDAYQGTAASAALRAADGTAGLVQVELGSGLSSSAQTKTLHAVENRLERLGGQLPAGGTVRLGGALVSDEQVQQQTQSDTEVGEFITLPITLAVMVLIFGGFIAAGLPLLGAIGSIAGAFLALLGFSKLLSLDTSVLPIATILGLGLSIDYALLMVNRFREERAQGADIAQAVERTSATAGRTVAFSALTVAAALCGLFVFTSPIFSAVAAAGVSVVVIAVLAGTTLVPAMLGICGRRIRTPLKPVSDNGRFARVARWVQRRSIPVAIGVTALLLGLAAPFVTAHGQSAGWGVLPTSFSSRAVAKAVDSRFPQQKEATITVAVKGTPAQAETYAQHIRELDGVTSVGQAVPAGDGLVSIGVDTGGTAQGATAQQVVRELRADREGLTTYVTGSAAQVVDFKHEIATRGPWALGVAVLATFLLLFLMTGSVLVPVKAVLTNLMSLGASLGVLTLVFQDGWFSGVLGFTPTGGLEIWIPVLVFAFSFGLSMDYEVFLLARIKELHEEGYGCFRSVQCGVQRSGRIISSAALLMVIVFAGFSAGKMLDIKEMGVALAVAVAVDATLVRALLVPAAMTLAGRFNWWAPRPLRWLHARVGLREHQKLPPLPRPGRLVPVQRRAATETSIG